MISITCVTGSTQLTYLVFRLQKEATSVINHMHEANIGHSGSLVVFDELLKDLAIELSDNLTEKISKHQAIVSS